MKPRSNSRASKYAGWLAACAAGFAFGAAGMARAQSVDIITYHGGQARLGWNDRESALKPGTVRPSNFGKLWEARLDGQVYGSPLYVSGLTVGGKTRDVVFAATESNSVYALDAATGDTIWGPKTLAPPLNETQFNDCNNIHPQHGITGTPVIDRASNTIYVCSIAQPGVRQIYQVWALDITTGEAKPGWPVTLKGSYKGCNFDAGQLTQRGGLNLVNGWLYIPFGSRCDIGEWHGWVMGVNIASPSAPHRAFTPAPTVDGGGIWGSGGVAADAQGNIFCVTGNGNYNLDKGGSDVCESILKLVPDGDDLRLGTSPENWYVPNNWKQLDAADVDMGGSSPILLPDLPNVKTPRVVVTCGKDGLVYMANRDALGGVGGEIQKQRLFGDPKTTYHSNIKTTPAYFDSGASGRFVYVTGNETGPGGNAGIVALKIGASGGKPHMDVAWTLKKPLYQSGAPFVTSNGGRDGIVWVIESNKDDGDVGPPGILHAFNAVTGSELYRSDEIPTRDTLEDARKFSCPTVANGRVFVGTHGVVCYGLLANKPAAKEAK